MIALKRAAERYPNIATSWVEQGNVELGRQVVAALRDVLTLRRRP